MAIEYWNDRVQVTHNLNDKECDNLNNYFFKNQNKTLRLIWFEDVKELSFISKLTNVRDIKIQYSNLDNINFLSSLINLEILDISEMEGNLDVSAIKNLKKLKVLNLNLNKATRQTDLSILDEINLEEFYFKGKFKKQSLNLNSLKKLKILAPQLGVINFEEIGELKELKEIRLFNQTIKSLKGIDKFVSVDKLMLSDIRMENQELLSPIFELPNLKILNLYYLKFIEDFTFIQNKHNLEYLNLWTLNGLKSYNGIERLTNLKSLYHCGEHSKPNEINLSKIKSLKKLTKIEIKIGNINNETKKIIEDLEKSVANRVASPTQ